MDYELIWKFWLGIWIGLPSILRVLEIWTINLNDFSLFMEQFILMPIILMGV